MKSNFISILAFLLFISQQILGNIECRELYPITENVRSQIKWGYIDCQGNVIVPPQFEKASNFKDGVGVISIINNFNTSNVQTKSEIHGGIVDRQGKITSFPDIKIYSDFSEGLAFAQIKTEWGFIDKVGNIKILLPSSLKVDENALAFGFENNVAGIQTDNGFYHIHKNGSTSLSYGVLTSIGPVDDSEGILTKDGWTIRNKAGKNLIPFQKIPIHYSEGLYLVKDEFGKWLYINSKGEKKLEVHFDYAGLFSEGLALIQVDNKWGFMDKTGAIKIAPEYEDAKDFSEGLAAVKVRGKYGFIDKNGAFVINPSLDYVHQSFSNSLAYIQKDNFSGYINRTGEWIWKQKN